MAGIQIDGVNNKIDFDDDADTSISSASDDTLVVEVGGNTLATVTATSVTVNDGVEITTADNTDTLTLTSTDADGSSGPNLRLYRNSSSPADGDDLSTIDFEGRNDNSQDVVYAQIKGLIADASDGTEDGKLELYHMFSGSLAPSLQLTEAGVVINESSNDIDFRVESNGDTHMLFVDGGNNGVGIGTDSPVSKLTVAGQITATGGAVSAPTYSFDSDTNTGMSRPTTDSINFVTGGTERMRVFSAGGVAISRTSALNPISGGLTVAATGANTTPAMSVQANTQASSGSIIVFHKGTGGECGSIGMTNLNAGSSVSYNTSSDYRLKENVNYDFDATTRLKKLKPAVFNWIDDESNDLEDGFLAHEVSNIVPEAITGIKDETTTHKKAVLDSYNNIIAENIEEADWTEGKAADEDGNRKYPTDSTWHETKTVPKYQQIDHSKLVPLMVKTIQELEARIATLEGN